ncbi:MAG: helix-turn-helix domain-containing protein [Phycisphaerales bacterium]
MANQHEGPGRIRSSFVLLAWTESEVDDEDAADDRRDQRWPKDRPVSGVGDEPGTVPAILINPREASVALGMSSRTLFTLTQEGRIPFVRIGRMVRYNPTLLEEWAQAQCRAATSSNHDRSS